MICVGTKKMKKKLCNATIALVLLSFCYFFTSNEAVTCKKKCYETTCGTCAISEADAKRISKDCKNYEWNGDNGGVWSTLDDVPDEVGDNSGVLVKHPKRGKVLLTFGSYWKADAYAYFFDNSRWENIEPPPVHGNHMEAVEYKNLVYVFGGDWKGGKGNRVQIYDVGANRWTNGKRMPWQMGAGNAVLIGHKMYACGGFGSNGDGTTSECGIYDPSKDSWSKMANMPQGRNHAAYGTDGEKYYIMTGRGKNNGDTLRFALGFDTVQIYDPKTNKWQSSNDKNSNIQPSPVPRAGVTIAVHYQGEMWLIGGSSKQDAPNACIKLGPNYLYYRTDIYNIATNTWREGPDMHFTAGATTPVIDQEEMKIYLPGGAVRENRSQPGETFQVLDLKLAVTQISPNPSLNKTNEFVPPANLCDEHTWDDIETTCGECKVLASNMRDEPYYGRCDNYCEAHHRRCVGAWEDLGNSCVMKTEGQCDKAFGNTDDVICECSLELDACLAAPCGENTDCVDMANGPKTAEGRICTCKTGYEGNPDEKCVDIDACKDYPCMENAGCVDREGESNTKAGRTCLCYEGYEMNEETMTCENIDVCEAYPCAGSDTADCQDIKGGLVSEEGRTCSCFFGTENYSEEEGCSDIDACINNPCGDHAVCEDFSESADDESGRTCSCEVGYEGDAETGCTDIDACAVTPCTGEHVSCDDLEASGSTSDGRTCECGTGYESYSEQSGCKDINACIDNPCGKNARCVDLSGEENNNSGRSCSCLDGYEGNPEKECRLNVVKSSQDASITAGEDKAAILVAEVIGVDGDDDSSATTITSTTGAISMTTYLLSLAVISVVML